MPETNEANANGQVNQSAYFTLDAADAERFRTVLQQAEAQNASSNAGSAQTDSWLDALKAYQQDPSAIAYEDALLAAGGEQPAAEAPPASGDLHSLHPLGPGSRITYDLLVPPGYKTPGATVFRDSVLEAMGEAGQSTTPRSGAVFKRVGGIGKIAGPAAAGYGAYAAFEDVANAKPGEKGDALLKAAGQTGGGYVGSFVGAATGGFLLAGGAAILMATPPGWLAIGLGLAGSLVGGYIGTAFGGSIAERASMSPQEAQEADRREYEEYWGGNRTENQPAEEPWDQWGPLLAPASPEPEAEPEVRPAGGVVAPASPTPQPAPSEPPAPEPEPAPEPAPPVRAAPKPSPKPEPEPEEPFGPPPPPEPEDPDDPDPGLVARPNPDADPQPGTGPTYPVYTSRGVGVIRPMEDAPILDSGSFDLVSIYNRPNGPGAIRPMEDAPIFDGGSFDLAGIYNRPNGPGVVNPVPDEIAAPTPRGGTVPIGPDPTIMTANLGRFGLGTI